MTERIKVDNCGIGKEFEVDIKHPFFPIAGENVCETYCGKCTFGFPEGYALLCTDTSRTLLLCHTGGCDYHTKSE
jgi:hypothetical protein